MKTEKRGYRPKEASLYLGISLSHLWGLIKSGDLKSVKLSDKVTILTKETLDKYLDLKMGASIWNHH